MHAKVLHPRAIWLTTALALSAFVAALLVASPAQTAPGDIADLSVTKTDSPDPVTVGATLTYTIVVANNGPAAATGVTLVDRIPSHSDFVSAAASAGKCDRNGRRVTCEIGALAMGSTATATIGVRPTKRGTIENTASVESVETDPIAINDRAIAVTRVTEPSHCRGVAATIVGTPGVDRLIGTEGPDVIAGEGGADVIFGRGGRDLICSGGGNDWVNAGPAADRVFGGIGADRLLGRGGPDLLVGNPGRDVLKGNRGDDRLRGGTGFDRCFGGRGFDRKRSCER